MMAGADGLPNPADIRPLVSGGNPIDLEVGPGADLFYVDFNGGVIHLLSFGSSPTSCALGSFDAQFFGNTALAGEPVLRRCDPAIDYDWGFGSPATAVAVDNFSARWSGQFSFSGGSTTFTATTDDGIRVYVDGTLVIDEWRDQAPTTFNATTNIAAGTHAVTVEYYENSGGAVARVSWQSGSVNAPPVPVIDAPAATLTYAVGDGISFSGHATDAEDGTLPASALRWSLIVHHCTTPTDCHAHNVRSWTGVSSETFNAPDHSYPSNSSSR